MTFRNESLPLARDTQLTMRAAPRGTREARVAGCFRGVVVLLLATLAAGAMAPSVGAQGPSIGRKATTVDGLLAYPVFFHTQAVRLRGELRVRDNVVLLASEAREVELAGDRVEGTGQGGRLVEVLGTFVDPGRLEPGDPRLRGVDIAARSQARLGKPWPGINELPLLIVDDLADPLVTSTPSVRALALDPSRFVDQTVTVTGRFRGRNLFGDQPNAPGRSRWDFVIALADASVWVTGVRPRGDKFNLDIEARADAGRWLEVTGTVGQHRGLVYIDAKSIRLASAPADAAPAEPVARVPTMGPPPEVVFSTPTQDEIDVPPATVVRIQFSRDLRKETLQGRVKASYVAGQSAERGEPQDPPIDVTLNYNEASRSLELRFREPLARFRGVQIELLEGIEGTDGASLAPWTLRFVVGG